MPTAYQGMDVSWPFKARQLGDEINFACPSNTETWAGLEGKRALLQLENSYMAVVRQC